MIVRAIDGNHDWTFGNGQQNYLTGNAAIAQMINTSLQSFLGDCFFDIYAGLDWFNLLGAKDKVRLQLAINAVILGVDGVVALLNSSVSTDSTRKITITYSVNTVYTQNITLSSIVTI